MQCVHAPCTPLAPIGAMSSFPSIAAILFQYHFKYTEFPIYTPCLVWWRIRPQLLQSTVPISNIDIWCLYSNSCSTTWLILYHRHYGFEVNSHLMQRKSVTSIKHAPLTSSAIFTSVDHVFMKTLDVTLQVRCSTR